MTPAKLYAAIVAFKDRCVEAYIRGAAEEQAERHPVPPLGTCGLCGREIDYAAKEYERGVQEERKKWTAAVGSARDAWGTVATRDASVARGTLRAVLAHRATKDVPQ